VAAIGGGTIAGQLIVLGVTPILSRLYPTAAFGGYAVVTAVATAVTPSAALKLDAALVIPAAEDTARRLTRLALAAGVASGILVAAAMALIQALSDSVGWDGIPFAPLWAGATVVLGSGFSTLTQAALRYKAYRVVAQRVPVQATAVACAQLGAAALSPSATGLIGANVVGRAFGFLPLLRVVRPLLRGTRLGGYKQALREFWRMPAIMTPSTLINDLSRQLPIIFFAAWFGASLTGEMSVAQRVVLLPLAVVGEAVARVFVAETASRMREGTGRITPYYLRLSLALAACGTATATAVITLGPWLCPIVLGEDWQACGYFAQALAVSAAAALVGSPLSQIYTLLQSPAAMAMAGIRLAIIGSAAAIIYATQMAAIAACWTFAIAQALHYLIYWLGGLGLAKRYDARQSA
jgi:O-antigen/teichoic acid export membrane protein